MGFSHVVSIFLLSIHINSKNQKKNNIKLVVAQSGEVALLRLCKRSLLGGPGLLTASLAAVSFSRITVTFQCPILVSLPLYCLDVSSVFKVVGVLFALFLNGY